MDTRYSAEQLELQRSAAAVVADLGPRTVDDLDDAARRQRLADGSSSGVRLVDVALPEPVFETDLSRAIAPVALGDVAPDGEGATVGEAAVARSRALALTITIADLLGSMEGVLDTTTEYAKER